MFTKPFSQISKKDSEIAGGKGASLGEMLNAGVSVPDGFVVLSVTFDAFLKEVDLVQEIDSILEKVDHKTISSVESASEKIQGLIKDAIMPENIASEILSEFKKLDTEFVAVRSSATAEDGTDHAWAGQLDSYLNTTEKDILERVQHCWASLFTPRAIFYRFEKGLHDTHISVAVVIQKMVNSEKSGIAFSVHPVTEDRNQLIIEAGLGLGEAIVSGSVTPDSYVVEKEPRNIIDINVNHQNRALYRKPEGGNEWKDLGHRGKEQILNKEEILGLSGIILNIENHYGFPCDIEWAFEGGKFYIVQSRPITTLKIKNNGPKQNFEKAYTRDTSLIIQQGWFEVLYSGIEKLDIQREFDTPVVHFMNRGSIEIWENETYTKWFLDKLLEKNTNNPDIVKDTIKKFEEELPYFNSCWKKGPISNIKELKTYIEKVFNLMVGFVTFYYSAYDERTPKDIRDWSLEIRDKDSFFASNDRLIRDSLKEIYPNLAGYESCILFDEIENPPSLETLKKRREAFVVVGRVYSNIENILDYSKNKEDFNFHFEKPEENPDDIKGQIGFKGVIRGKVKLLLRNDQVSEVQEGDIIVSPMTTPEHVPAMEKAAAFVTDEGGITCHAAIVAREMQKPCVIGTKFATQILKDGDEVEVDADNGIVRILGANNENDLNPKNYIRMFAGKAFSYILTNLFLTHYGTLGVLSMQDEESWMSFLPKSSHIKTLREGQELYTSQKAFDNFHREFRDYMTSTSAYCQSILIQEKVSLGDVKEFLTRASQHWVFYSKTEFFYTDNINLEKMVISIEEFDKLKLDGRAYLNKLIFEDTGYVKSLLNIISKQANVHLSELLNYKVEEILSLVKDGSVVSLETIKEREVFFGSQDLTLFGDSSRDLVGKFLEPYREISSVIKGTVARKGLVTAKARVLMPEFKDFDKILKAVEMMEKGEVLVAETTSPDIIAACKKASAIITNQGGTLSHAAIISRELGIPCIIGTDKDVILNIKTGDLLEVDANNGIIRIINK